MLTTFVVCRLKVSGNGNHKYIINIRTKERRKWLENIIIKKNIHTDEKQIYLITIKGENDLIK